MMLMKDQMSIINREGVMKTHKILIQRSKTQIIHAYREAVKLMDEVRKLIDDIGESCDVISKSKSKLSVAVS